MRPLSPRSGPASARTALTTLALSLAGLGLAPPAHALDLRVRPVGPDGAPLDARVYVTQSNGVQYPSAPNAPLQAHVNLRVNYFYPDGVTPLVVPFGIYHLRGWHGPEWFPADRTVGIFSDSVVTLPLSRFDDLRPRGWYSSDQHVHAEHPPLEYAITPEQSLRVAHAEGLSVIHMLDQDSHFTGAPSALSDSLTTLDQSYEYRNQIWGHVEFPGLKLPTDGECCLSPEDSWPMIHDIRPSIEAQGAMLVLAHPHTTELYTSLADWPGAGLGRELPVLAGLGDLDALDVVSYSNAPDTDWQEWYDLLNCGIDVPADAGTDAVLNWFENAPAGGWRAYARVADGAAPFYDRYLAALRAGRTFVTNAPLLPRFEVSGRSPGDALDVPADTLIRPVSIEASCVFGLTRVSLIADGSEVWALPLTGRSRIDTTFAYAGRTPRFFTLRADGVAGDPLLGGLAPVGQTNALRVLQAGARRPLTVTCAKEQDAIDRVESFIDAYGHFSAPWQRDSVFARCERAKAFFGRAFVLPPNPFAIVSDQPGTPVRFTWTRATDPELFDRIAYDLELSPDSAFASPLHVACTDTTALFALPGVGDGWWWRVSALDRAGRRRLATGSPRAVMQGFTGVTPGGGAAPPRAWPNPARDVVRFAGFGDDLHIVDLAGRDVARLGRGLTRESGALRWELARSAAPPGLYFARSASRGVTVRVVRLP